MYLPVRLNHFKMDYVCNLNESYIKIAKNELNEDPINRKGAILKLKEWVEEQPHIQFPTGKLICHNVIGAD